MNNRELANRVAQRVCSVLSYTPSETQWKSLVDGVEKELQAAQQTRVPDGALVVRDSSGVVTCSVCGTGLGVE
jgi:hypothetical protein